MTDDSVSMSSVIPACIYEIRPDLFIAIATVILALVTAWMALETRQTAAAAIKALEFEQMPILGIRDVKVDVGRWQPGQLARIPSIHIGMELFNSGRVPVRYKVKSFAATFANLHGVKSGESGGGRVLPGASTIFWPPRISLSPPVETFPADGRIRFEYEYCDGAGRQARQTVDIVDFTVYRGDDGSYMSRWWSVDEPSPA
jgi:hypothetical protein